jgi:sugar lactone lactonase YvrE
MSQHGAGRSARLLTALILTAGLPVAGVAGAAPAAARAPEKPEAAKYDPITPFVVGTVGGNDLYADPVTGRVFGVPTKESPGDGPAPYDPAYPHTTWQGWDSRLAGQRRNVFYTPHAETQAAGRMDTVLGGRCDLRPGPQVAVDPGSVRVDKAGRVFWLDQAWSAHTKPAAYVRVLGTDGLVRTIGSVAGPIDGRAFRDLGSTTGLSRFTPDDNGGVYYTYEGYFVGMSPGEVAAGLKVFDDVPIATVVGHVKADGTSSYVAGIPGWRWTWASSTGWSADGSGHGWTAGESPNPADNEPNDGKPVEQARFRALTAIDNVGAASLVVADGDRPSGNSSTRGASGQRTEIASAPGTHDDVKATTIRVLNRSKNAMTFYAGTGHEVRIAAGTTGTIAGQRLDADKLPAPAAGTMSDPLKTRLSYVSAIDWGSDGVVRMLMAGDSTVQVLALNTTSKTRRANGVALPPGAITVVAGGDRGDAGDGGKGTAAKFAVGNYNGWYAGDLAVAKDGSAYVADTLNNRVRRLDPNGTVTAVTALHVTQPMGVAFRGDELLVSDWGNAFIRGLRGGGTPRVVAGTGNAAHCGDGGPAHGAGAGAPHDVVTDGRGNTYVADIVLGVVRRIDRAGRVTTVAGRPLHCPSGNPAFTGAAPCPPPAAAGDGGPATRAVLRAPGYLLVDRYDNLYISDGGRVRYVNFGAKPITVQGVTVPAGAIQTIVEGEDTVTKIVANGALGVAPAAYYQLVGLSGLALDDLGTLYVGDVARNRIITKNWCGFVDTIAGSGGLAEFGNNGDGGPAAAALVTPLGLAWDEPHHVLYVAAGSEQRIRAINLGTSTVTVQNVEIAPGTIDTVAGGAPCRGTGLIVVPAGWRCAYGDGGQARRAALHLPVGIAVKPDGRLFVADATVSLVRVVEKNGVIGTLAGLTPPVTGSNPSDGLWLVGGECAEGRRSYDSCLSGPTGVHLDARGDLLVTDALGGVVHTIRDALHAPLRPAFRDAPATGDGWSFTANQLLTNGEENDFVEPSLGIDPEGHAYVTAFEVEHDGDADGCPVWRVDLDGDGHGNDTVGYLSKPDVTPLDSAVLNTPGAQCSVAAGGVDPLSAQALLGEKYRVSHTATRKPGVLNLKYGMTVNAATSTDAGETFMGTSAGLAGGVPGLVRQAYIAPDGGDATLMTYNATVVGTNGSTSAAIGLARSVNGAAYVHVSQIPYTTTVAPNGNRRTEGNDSGDDPTTAPVVTKNAVYVPIEQLVAYYDANQTFLGSDSVMTVARSTDRGQTWTRSAPVFETACARSAGSYSFWVPDAYCWGHHGKPNIAADDAGNLYAVWDEGGHAWLRTSTDGGATWAPKVRVDRDGVTVAVMPQVVAGEGGRIAVAFLGTTSRVAGPGSRDAEYWVYLSYVDRASSAARTFTQSLASDHRVHTGDVCYRGAICWGDGLVGNEIGDYFTAAMSPLDGRVVIAYVQDSGIVVGGDSVMGSGVVVTRQCDGPSLRPGLVAASPCGAATESRTVAPLPPVRCGVQGTDPAGDASFGGANRDALDLRSLQVTSDGPDLVVRIGVTKPTTDPMPPAGGLRWVAQWRSGGRGYWAGALTPTAAAVAAGGRVAYRYGHVTSGGTLVYDGDATGSLDATGVTIRLPRAKVSAVAGVRLSALSARSDALSGGVPDLRDQGLAGSWQAVDRLVAAYGHRAGDECPLGAGPPATGVAGPVLPVTPPPVTAHLPLRLPGGLGGPGAMAAPVPVVPLVPCNVTPPAPEPYPPAPPVPPRRSPGPEPRVVIPPVVAIAVLPPVPPPPAPIQAPGQAPNTNPAPGQQPNAQGQTQQNPMAQSGLVAERQERTSVAEELAMSFVGAAFAMSMAFGVWQLRRQRAEVAGVPVRVRGTPRA